MINFVKMENLFVPIILFLSFPLDLNLYSIILLPKLKSTNALKFIFVRYSNPVIFNPLFYKYN